MAQRTSSLAERETYRTLRMVEGQTYLAAVWSRLRRDTMAMVSILILAMISLLALSAPWSSAKILHTDPDKIDLNNTLAPPSHVHLLGTDEYGRDTLTRAIYAGRVSMSIGLAVAGISMTIGVFIGLISGYLGGRVDDVTNAIIQTLLNIPTLFLMVMLSLMIRPTPLLLAVIIGATGWMGTARLVRGEVFSIRERGYIEAARSIGASHWRIMLRHTLPNAASLIIVIASFDVAGGILAESGLSFLGVGVQPPTPSWGNMLINTRSYISSAIWLVLTPGFFIFATTLAIILLADGLRDALDPWRARGR
jgi:peptide/nickel transport system permease protein